MNQPPPPYDEAKYINVNGITKLNPKYNALVPINEKTSLRHSEYALPVLSTMQDYFDYNEASTSKNLSSKSLTKNVSESIDYMQSRDNELPDALFSIFQKYEIPIGLVSKLFDLNQYPVMEFIIDDSGSMGNITDSFHADGRAMTRWEEVFQRLKSMFEIIAYVTLQSHKFRLRFLNRRDTPELTFYRGGVCPEDFIISTNILLDKLSSVLPQGGTPIFECFNKSFSDNAGKHDGVSRYFFGDGEPNPGEKPKIEKLIKGRLHPKYNPITFLSCTNEDENVEWMKELEEISPYCAELDDFSDEEEEVLLDQGYGLPFSRGFHLICQLVAAFNPHDLDAMDESIPFTKYLLDRLLGIDHSEAEYKHYFSQFCQAQKRRPIKSDVDRKKKMFDWESCYSLFLKYDYPDQIGRVQNFKLSIHGYNDIESNRQNFAPCDGGTIHRKKKNCIIM